MTNTVNRVWSSSSYNDVLNISPTQIFTEKKWSVLHKKKAFISVCLAIKLPLKCYYLVTVRTKEKKGRNYYFKVV